MLWAQWGLTDRLMADPDLWLCHQCNDCSSRCPRGARPGDVMAALRRECVIHHATPRAFARWANRPASLLWMAVFTVALVATAAGLWRWCGLSAAELSLAGQRIVFPFWSRLPHALLGTIFALLIVVDVAVLAMGARRFWRNLNARSHEQIIRCHQFLSALRFLISCMIAQFATYLFINFNNGSVISLLFNAVLDL